MDKKAQAIEQLQTLIPLLVGVGIVLVVGFVIFSEIKPQVVDAEGGYQSFCPATNYTYNASIRQCCNSSGPVPDCDAGNVTGPGFPASFNATEDVQDAMDTIPTWLPVIIITVIGAILLALVTFLIRRR